MLRSPIAAPAITATRFAGTHRNAARVLLFLLLALIAFGQIATVPADPTNAPLEYEETDVALYAAVARRVGAGEDYYDVAAAEHRARGYPLRPFVAVRPPALALLTGALGQEGLAWLQRILLLASIGLLSVRLRRSGALRFEWVGAVFIAAFGLALLAGEGTAHWHENWAALFIILSLCARTERRWVASATLGLVAFLFRELAFPYLLLMAAFAWREGDRRELAGWSAAILLALASLYAHAAMVGAVTSAGDGASQGWARAGGWGFVMLIVYHCTAMMALPVAASAVALPLALLGWAAIRRGLHERILLLIAGYLAAFMLLGRPENFYWGMLVGPLVLPGLAFAPRALRDILRSAFPRLSADAGTPEG